MKKIAVGVILLLIFTLSVSPVHATSETEEFFEILIYGDGSWLFLIMFMGLGFLIAWKIRPFALVCSIACLYQCLDFALQEPNTAHIWKIVLLGLGSTFFLGRLFNIGFFKD